ncbi:MAG: Fic family protein [Pseudonocardiaceae bacterium]|nr:Fic family protein [Pseudonocardiaceae bacterium]
MRVGSWVEQRWVPSFEAPSRSGQRGGSYRAYLPDDLVHRPVVLSGELAARAADVEADVRRLSAAPEASSLEGLARFLLRSEAIASSRIEGMQVSPQQLALAELAQSEQLATTSFTRTAGLVANNITTLRKAASELATAPTITAAAIDDLHQALLPDERHHGQRIVQNWIGGSDWHPLDAQFVPPPPERVGALMEDLVQYAVGGTHAPLIQAALVHAQFETIHPYTDGNGRVGRALIHTVLTRRGLTPFAVLPLSLVLLTRSDAYLDGLTAYRYEAAASSDAAQSGVETWLRTFLEAADLAAEQVVRFTSELAELRARWREQLAARRNAQGVRRVPRADSAVARLIELLPETPLVTARTVQRLLAVSHPAARAALEELADAGIVVRKRVERATTGYFARDVFELLTFAERRLASTRWDTRQSPPSRPVPALPKP